jgi:hypothetical protein
MFIYKIIYILVVLVYSYFSKLLYYCINMSISVYPYPVSVQKKVDIT